MTAVDSTDGLFTDAPAGEAAGRWFVRGRQRAPFAWYGGKAYYAEWLMKHFPEHRVFVEPFGGAGNMLIRKRPSDVEVYNDLDARLVNFFTVLRERPMFEELVRRASLTPYSRDVFESLAMSPEPEEPVERAWWFFVRCRQSIGGLGMSKLTRKSWSVSLRTRRAMAEPVSKYLSAIDGLEDLAARFSTVLIENSPAEELVAKHDAEDVFFYCDPPYVPATRHGSLAKTYGHEMTLEQHRSLLELLLGCKGRVMISGYEHELYEELLGGWRRETVKGKSHLSNSGEDRLEVAWMNYE